MARPRVRRTRNTWTELRATLENRHFWVLMGWSALVVGMGGFLLWLAIKYWDTSLSLRTMQCQRWGNTNWSILALALIAPFFIVSVLGAISELWHNLERRHKHISTHWRPFVLFTLMVPVLGGMILAILRC